MEQVSVKTVGMTGNTGESDYKDLINKPRFNGTEIAGNVLANLVYPVGCIYMSMIDTNPATLFGGTWEQIKDRFIYAAGTKNVETTGGEETHILTGAEMPAHGHEVYNWNKGGTLGSAKGYDSTGSTDTTVTTGGMAVINTAYTWENGTPQVVGSGYGDRGGRTARSGLGHAHNNMPPYIVAYMWKRIA